jgi:hypothetical protein
MKPHGNTGNKNAAKPLGERKPRIKYTTVSLRVEDAERWQKEAARCKLSLAAWVKFKCDK